MCIFPASHDVKFIAWAIWLLAASALAAGAGAATPSFQCGKAKTWVEKSICDSDALSGQDSQLAADYARLLAKLTGDAARQFAAEQHAWRITRDECHDTIDPFDCLWKKYEERITALRMRPEFPLDDAPPHADSPPQKEFADISIKDGASGWAKGLSTYLKAISACVSVAPIEMIAVSNAWSEQENVVVRFRAGNEETWLCSAHRDDSRVIEIRERLSEENLPAGGPYFYLSVSPPAATCGAIQVVDSRDQVVGWLANRLCE